MSKELVKLSQQLHSAGSIKVWSLIISFFGDSIVDRGGNIAASTVQTVLDQVDVGDGAVRTAFSRLASDGWVHREKLGRRSYYQLTKEGQTPFSQAAKQIYSPVIKRTQCDDTWLLGIHQEKCDVDNVAIANLIALPSRAVLVWKPEPSDAQQLQELGYLTVTGACDEVPEWVVSYLRPADWISQVEQLQTVFKKLAKNPPSDPLAALATRTLLIHQWRRLLLRYSSLPELLKGQSLAIEDDCRGFVGKLYHQLTEPAEQWLSEHGTSREGELPEAKTNPADRFTDHYLALNNL